MVPGSSAAYKQARVDFAWRQCAAVDRCESRSDGSTRCAETALLGFEKRLKNVLLGPDEHQRHGNSISRTRRFRGLRPRSSVFYHLGGCWRFFAPRRQSNSFAGENPGPQQPGFPHKGGPADYGKRLRRMSQRGAFVLQAEAAHPQGFPHKGGVSRGEGGRDQRRIEVRRGSGEGLADYGSLSRLNKEIPG